MGEGEVACGEGAVAAPEVFFLFRKTLACCQKMVEEDVPLRTRESAVVCRIPQRGLPPGATPEMRVPEGEYRTESSKD